MMNSIIKVTYPMKEYWNIYYIVEKYVVNWTTIYHKFNPDRIVNCEFKCRKWNVKKCLEALELAKKMGHEVEVVG